MAVGPRCCHPPPTRLSRAALHLLFPRSSCSDLATCLGTPTTEWSKQSDRRCDAARPCTPQLSRPPIKVVPPVNRCTVPSSAKGPLSRRRGRRPYRQARQVLRGRQVQEGTCQGPSSPVASCLQASQDKSGSGRQQRCRRSSLLPSPGAQVPVQVTLCQLACSAVACQQLTWGAHHWPSTGGGVHHHGRTAGHAREHLQSRQQGTQSFSKECSCWQACQGGMLRRARRLTRCPQPTARRATAHWTPASCKTSSPPHPTPQAPGLPAWAWACPAALAPSDAP